MLKHAIFLCALLFVSIVNTDKNPSEELFKLKSKAIAEIQRYNSALDEYLRKPDILVDQLHTEMVRFMKAMYEETNKTLTEVMKSKEISTVKNTSNCTKKFYVIEKASDHISDQIEGMSTDMNEIDGIRTFIDNIVKKRQKMFDGFLNDIDNCITSNSNANSISRTKDCITTVLIDAQDAKETSDRMLTNPKHSLANLYTHKSKQIEIEKTNFRKELDDIAIRVINCLKSVTKN